MTAASGRVSDATICTRCGAEMDELMDVCHDCAARVVLWLDGLLVGTRRKVGQWRWRARSVMRDVVRANRDLVTVDPAAVLKLVDDAYPFGERAMHPYKAWLEERKVLREVLTPSPKPEEPTVDDFAAVEVAIDLYETGRVDEAAALLAEQAPRRLNRKCPACGSRPGEQCNDGEKPGEPFIVQDVLDDGSIEYVSHSTTVRAFLVVPHLSRVTPPATPTPAPLPLFERNAT